MKIEQPKYKGTVTIKYRIDAKDFNPQRDAATACRIYPDDYPNNKGYEFEKGEEHADMTWLEWTKLCTEAARNLIPQDEAQ
jgi:hypothetical protein